MLTVHQICKSFGPDLILDKISFNLSTGERLGLVGPNGCGKTTLLRILVGEDSPDAGSFYLDPAARLGYLPQGYQPDPTQTLGRFLQSRGGDPENLELQLSALAAALARNPAEAGLQHRYDQVLAGLEAALERAGHLPGILAALGLDIFPLDTPVAILSGGQKTRLALAGVLLEAPRVLLLDEPTNHLDLEMLTWLENWLSSYRGAALIVSHDRAFLDNTVTGILELDENTHAIKAYPGNYSAYYEQKQAELEHRWQAYTDQQEEIARLRAAAASVRTTARFRVGGKADTGDKFAKGFFANRSLERVRLAKQIERRVERLLNEDHIDKPRQAWQMKLDFAEAPGGSGFSVSGRDVLALEDLSIGYGEHVLQSGLNLSLPRGARLALVGPNGSGKTTLLRTIAGRIPPLAGRVRLGAGVRAGYMSQEQEHLDPTQDAFTTLWKLAPLSETEARSYLHRFLFTGDEVFTPVGSLSYGERARLSLACLAAQGCNLLLLDEPLNHLDIPSRARFEQALTSYEGTILVVTHDRYFIDAFATQVWAFEQG